MASHRSSFKTSYEAKCSAFSITRLIYIHCVSQENFTVMLKGFPCATLICKEVHVSYLESLSQRRTCIVPEFVAEKAVKDIFDGVLSPALVRLNSSCDITFVNPEDTSEESKGTILWDFEILRPNVRAAVVQASIIKENKPIDLFCHPVDLSQAECNCGECRPQMSCLVSLMEAEELTSDMDLLNISQEYSSQDEAEAEAEESSEELHAERFVVKGSHHEERYQKALKKCDEAIRIKEVVHLRTEFEPDNIEDCNAIKFEVNFDNDWLIMGYCDVKKLPKLHCAKNSEELRDMSLLYVKREWIPWIRKFSFYACINIVKKGRWDKDDSTNRYNSNLQG